MIKSRIINKCAAIFLERKHEEITCKSTHYIHPPPQLTIKRTRDKWTRKTTSHISLYIECIWSWPCKIIDTPVSNLQKQRRRRPTVPHWVTCNWILDAWRDNKMFVINIRHKLTQKNRGLWIAKDKARSGKMGGLDNKLNAQFQVQVVLGWVEFIHTLFVYFYE